MLSSTIGSGSDADVLKRLLPQFVRRIVDYREIDLQLTLSQFRNLLFDPKAVFKSATFHHQTQGRWARDDPGFLVIEVALVVFAAVAYFLALEPFSILGFLMTIVWTLVHFFAVASLVATVGMWLANTYMTPAQGSAEPSTAPSSASSLAASPAPAPTSARQRVEWWYCFDVHCDGFFPFFVFTRLAQFLLLPVLYYDSMVVVILSEALYFTAFSYYIYITFLGYFTLPFLQNAERLLLWFVPNPTMHLNPCACPVRQHHVLIHVLPRSNSNVQVSFHFARCRSSAMLDFSCQLVNSCHRIVDFLSWLSAFRV